MIWLIGNRGMLGCDVERLMQHKGLDHVCSDMEVDIVDEKALASFANTCRPDWIINCAAYTHVDKAEDEVALAFEINAEGAENISRISKKMEARLIHISTDYVFDGMKKGDYNESDRTNPQNVYGMSKCEGELSVRKVHAQHFIIRTAWLYGMNGSNFVHTMIRLFRERNKVEVVADQWGSPTFTHDLANTLLTIIEQDSTAYGTYHITNEGITNWYAFAKEIYQGCLRHGIPVNEVHIVPIETAAYPARALRPHNSVLSKKKFKSTFDTTINTWEKALDAFLKEIAHGNGER